MCRMKPELVSFQAPAGAEVGQEQGEPHCDMNLARWEAGAPRCEAGGATLLRSAAPWEVLKVWISQINPSRCASNFEFYFIFQQGDLLQWQTDLQASHQQFQEYLFLWLFTFYFCEQAFDPSNNPNPNVLKVNWCTVLNSLVTSWIRLIEPVMNRVSIVNSHS